MVVTYYIKLFRTGADRHNGILMSLLLVIAETKINIFNKFCVSKFINIANISILGPNLPESIILGQDNQLQVIYS